ncbi:MAG: hypothetical protein LBN20_05490 [Endomicrobium sp.]|jgi:3-deoxy-D-manno-octulosonic-acid transferase|nr:hypothetical protein [Endomicrobium sp.]
MTAFFLFIYNFLFAVFFIILIPFGLIFSSNFRRNFFYKTKERLAIWDFKCDISKKTLWFHCSSIGEVRAVEPLLSSLKDDKTQIVLTVVTKTAREYAKDLKSIDFIALLPLDLYPIMSKAFKIINPDIFLPIETELWPSMFYSAHRKKIKIVSVNGRISEKTFRTYNKMSFFWAGFISLIDTVLARSADDAQRYEILSKGKTKTFVTGNIKYDRDFSSGASRTDFNLKEDDIVWTAGSIREDEIEAIIEVYKILIKTYPNIKMFIAPRHIDKIENIKTALDKAKIPFTLFSSGIHRESGSAILVDVFGKLQDIYSISDICFIGGSLIDKGGQNPIEPAAYAKPVLFGKYMSNFKMEAKLLTDNGGALIVKNASDLAQVSINLLSDRQKLKDMGAKALQTVKSQKGSIKLTIDKIREFK